MITYLLTLFAPTNTSIRGKTDMYMDWEYRNFGLRNTRVNVKKGLLYKVYRIREIFAWAKLRVLNLQKKFSRNECVTI